MKESLLTGKKMPYCPGCGHHLDTVALAKAFEKLSADPLDVILVSDIGCCGLIDPLVNCHTVHGLHGRACAFAMGIAMGLDDRRKKVVAIQGDGGATIGLQHLLSAARMNVDMTLLILNNMVYGMTGGQVSGLTPSGMAVDKRSEETHAPPFSVCDLAHEAGASHVSRIVGRGDFSDRLVDAFRVEGFSLVEIVGLCPTYGVRTKSEMAELGYEEMTRENIRFPYSVRNAAPRSLFDRMSDVEARYESSLESRMEIVIAGSAGEGVQLAAELLARSGVAAGLKATKKGEYPVTVGTGFSVAEVILAREEIHYTGIESPDVMVIVSEDGLAQVKDRVGDRTKTIIDRSLAALPAMKGIAADFRKGKGGRTAALAAISYWLRQSRVLPLEALLDSGKEFGKGHLVESVIEEADQVEAIEL
jgi:pyruvate/2-oxoacid:ferredoxin oxidoreductase beta subunit/Pyruvate/2-oxoacid:ferredoxin oxidoreductase gamma subunit